MSELGNTNTSSVLDLLKAIKSGSLNPSSLGASRRRSCVEFLWDDGLSTHEMAALLKVSERTIGRDKKTIRKRNAHAFDPGSTLELAAELQRLVNASIEKVRRVGRGASSSNSERIVAATKAVELFDQMLARFQSMGFLIPPNTINAPVSDGAVDDMRVLIETLRLNVVAQRHEGVPQSHELRALMYEICEQAGSPEITKLVQKYLGDYDKGGRHEIG